MKNVSLKSVGIFILTFILSMQIGIVGANATESQENTRIGQRVSTGDLKISKVVEGTDSNQTFEFTVTFNAKGEYPYEGDNVADGSIQSGDVIALKSGQSITIKNLKSGTKYTVAEAETDLYAMAMAGQQGVIIAGETADAEFVGGEKPVINLMPTHPAPPDLEEPEE